LDIDNNRLVPEVTPSDALLAMQEDILRDVPRDATAIEVAAYMRGWVARDRRERLQSSPEQSMANFWADLPGWNEGSSWTRLPDGRVVPTRGRNGAPRAMSLGEALAVGCPCGEGAILHLSPCPLADPQAKANKNNQTQSANE
jgi:hypothetical protein